MPQAVVGRLMRWTRWQLHFWRMTWHAAPWLTAVGVLLVVLRGVGVWLTIYASGRLVQQLGDRSGDVWVWLALLGMGIALEPLAAAWLESVVAGIQERFSRQQVLLVADAALAPHGIEHLENPEKAARFSDIEDYLRGMFGVNAMNAVWSVIGYGSIGVAGFVAVAQWSWWAALIALVAYRATAVTWTAYLDVLLRDLVEDGSLGRRQADYLRSLPLERAGGKEIRLFGLTPWILRRYHEVWAAAFVGIWQRRSKALRPALAGSVAAMVLLAACYVWAGRDAWSGTMSAATLVVVMQGLVQLAGLGPLGDYNVQAIRARFYENEIRELRTSYGLPPTLHDDPDSTAVVPATGAVAVDFTDVGFTYPSRAEPVFTGLDLHVPAGQSVAIVGVNGVGKSTLIKLLCGLYPADHGTVRVDGRDPATDEAARRKVATIFQEFVRYHLTLRENVALPLLAANAGAEPAADAAGDPTPAADRALHAAAGADVLGRVGGDWDTILEPGYDGGTELSGGQWQRVAIARALLAVDAGAGVLVLDEPTAALDVRAEAEIFSRFLEVTRGVTTILVSHRLSSVRHADRIVVLGPEGVVQDGSHDELLNSGGAYAEMFRLQASRFEKASGDDEFVEVSS
ncbi:ABC transporter ATP-binding protein [Flexivirga sp. ID2601S]|uniref:ABC transporter ATP-binding protein n=1 Tax=Flexivirga aerilata TaxID=1656889 RepID=A0A849AGF9_9MICO|nr:ABC transporter ATP-binding protein [Flexivirga aerilata]NNG38351.1 ABC transporter ATP-binding protein [Flexivirga aerilata]